MDDIVYTLEEVATATGWTTEKILKMVLTNKAKAVLKTIKARYQHEKTKTYIDYFTQSQYDHIVTLARSQQSKPAYEQLEADIIELKAENERLHDKLRSKPTKTTEHPNSLNKSRAIIQALYELANKPSHKQIINKAEQLGYTVSSDTLTNRLN